MMRSLLLVLFSALFMTTVSGCTADAPETGDATDDAPALPEDAERIVFFGDSITQAGADPGGYVTLVAESLAVLPGAYDVVGAGISGNKIADLLGRVDADVLAHNPTHVIIYIGINDVWHWFKFEPEGTEKAAFDEGLRALVTRIQEAGAEVTLCTPSVIGEAPDFSTEEDAMLEEYAEVSRDVARDTGADLCDLRQAFKSYLIENNTDGRAEGVLTTDGVHLNDAGNRFVANQMLDAILD